MRYIARVSRTSVGFQTFEVEASDEDAASDLAFDLAFDDGEWEDEETISHSIELTEIEE